MRVGVYGYTDKRPVVYALLKLLQDMGDVALFSNNRHYQRLIEDRESQGHVSNVFVSVSDATPDEIFEEIGHNEADFDHVIYDIVDTVPENLDSLIYVKGIEVEQEADFLEVLGEHQTIKFTYDGKAEKGVFNVQPVSAIWSSVETLEALGIFVPMPSKTLNTSLAKIVCGPLSIGEKEALRVLTRRWGK